MKTFLFVWQAIVLGITLGVAVAQDNQTSSYPKVKLSELALPEWQNYSPIEARLFEEKLNSFRSRQAIPERQILRGNYTATLNDDQLEDGRFMLRLSDAANPPTGSQLSFGPSNLQQLQIEDSTGSLGLATDDQGNLLSLRATRDDEISGTWIAESTRRGRAIVFQLQLPQAAVSTVEIEADSKLQATSPNGLVRKLDDAEGMTRWLFLPTDPQKVTVEFSSIARSPSDRSRRTGVAADVLINEAETRLNWTVPLRPGPALFATFELSKPCQIRSVQSGDQSLTWSQKGAAISVDLLQRTSDRPLQIQATVKTPLNAPFSIPFLKPLQLVQAQQVESLQLESSVVRVQVDPLLAVERPVLTDVLQESFTADGNRQVLELRQFGAKPKVELRLLRSLPLIEERMVAASGTTNSPADTVIWINIKAAAGVVDRLSWIVPNAWRITDVREEALKSSPLLFRQDAVEDESSFELQTMLRTPLSVGNDQTLRITMQAIDRSTANRTPASLQNSSYIRKTDLVAITDADDPRLGQIWSETDEPEIKREDLLWLTTRELEGCTFVQREQLKSVTSDSPQREDTFASIYSTVELQESSVVETVRIRLRNSTELPPRFTIETTSGLRPELSEAAEGTDWFRSGESNNADAWTLELPTDRRRSERLTDFEFVLSNVRTLSDRMPGLVVKIRNATLQGGRLEQPTTESGLVLRLNKNNTDEALEQTIEYPAENFRLEILNSDTNANRIAVNGRSYLLLAADGEMLRATELHRCIVQAGGLNRFLIVRTASRDIRFFINGAEIFVAAVDGRYELPIPSGSSPTRLDIIARSRLKTRFDCRLLSFENAEETNIVTTVQSAPGQIIKGINPPPRCDSTTIADTIRDTQPIHADLHQRVADFESLWRLSASLEADHVIVTGETQTLQIMAAESRLTWTVVIGVATFLLWQIIRKHPLTLAGALLIVVVFLKWLILNNWPFILVGVTAGTLCFGLQMTGKLLITRPAADSRSPRLIGSTIAAIALLSLGTALADDRPLVVRPLTEASTVPLLFVDNDYLDSLTSDSNNSTPCVALSVDVKLKWQQPGIVEGYVSVVTGCRSGQAGKLKLPTEGITLTSASCDQQVIFPRKQRDGSTFIDVPESSEFQALLSPDTDSVSSDGPDRYAGWDIRTVKYTFLQSITMGNAEYQCEVPFPKSPIAILRLEDPQKLLEAVYVGSNRFTLKDSSIVLPPVYHANRLSARLKPRQRNGESVGDRKAKVDISAVVSPNRVELTAEYRIRPANLSTPNAIVGIVPGQSLAVETLQGNSLRWSLLGDEIAVAIAPDASGEQRFRLIQTVSSELNTIRNVPLGALLQVNPQRIDFATLSARATEPFLLQPMLADGRPLVPVAESALPGTPNLRKRFQLPTDTRDVSFELVARSSSIEPVISQQVIVRDERIDWSCLCELDVSGAPIFQQLIYVSPDVTIETIDARNGDTTRLQSWSRSRDAVLITLREATQGMINIRLNGFTKRIAGKNTRLPVITFPDGIIPLASDLEIRSASESRCYLNAMGGAIADNQFDLSTPLVSTPLRFSVIDDQDPVVIQAAQDQAIQGSLTSYVYSASGQARIAHALSCELADARSPVRFRLRNTNSTATNIAVFRNGQPVDVAVENGIVTVPPSPDDSPKIRLMIAEQIPGIRNNSLSASLPEFEDSFVLTGSKCFDLREDQIGRSERIPVIDRSDFATIDLILPEQGTRQSMTTNLDGRQLLIRTLTPTKGNEIAEAAGGVAYVDEEHLVRIGDNFVSGTTNLLSFATSPRAKLQLNVPEQTIVTRIVINGRSALIGPPKSSIDLPLDAVVSQVTVDWVRESNSALLDDDFVVSLVTTSAAQKDRRIGIVDQTSSTRLSLKYSSLNTRELQETQTQSLSSGLQFAELQNNERNEATSQEAVASLLTALNQQISRLSPEAATAYSAAIQDRPQQTNWIRLEEADIRFRLRRRWSNLNFSLLLAGTVMVTIPMVQRRKRRQMLNTSEASTIVRGPKQAIASEDPTQLVPPEADSQAQKSSTAM